MMPITRSSGVFSSGGEDVYYECAGDGEVVVLCHGLGGNHAVWYQQVPALAESFRVVTWDQRGFGMSTNHARESGPAAAVRDIGALLDHVGADRAHLVGQSMGGWAVMGFALEAPQCVASLVVCDSPAGVWNDAIAEIFSQRSRPQADAAAIGAHPAIGDSLRERDLAKAYLYQQIGSFRSGVEDAEMVSRLFSTRYPVQEVSRLRMPVLLIVGANDDLIPPEVMREVASVLGGAPLVEIRDSGHSPYFEQPDAWNRAVRSFLSGPS